MTEIAPQEGPGFGARERVALTAAGRGMLALTDLPRGRLAVVMAAALLLVSWAGGCSSAAKFRLRDGSVVRGRIVGADEGAIYYVEVDRRRARERRACLARCRAQRRELPMSPRTPRCHAACGEVGVIQRSDIVARRHPGEVQALVGGILAAVGTAVIVAGIFETEADSTERDVYLLMGAPVATAGLIQLVGGLALSTSSWGRLNDAPPRRVGWEVAR